MRNPRDPAVPVHDGPTMIAAWAATTERIRIGLLIANVVFRRPTVLAKQAVTLDHISAGRFDLGIGSGVWPTDHAMSGVPMWTPQERAGRNERSSTKPSPGCVPGAEVPPRVAYRLTEQGLVG